MSTLELKNISKIFEKKSSFFSKSFSKVTALEHVSIVADNLSICGIVGESGSGKTTLGKIIVGLECQNAGTICFNGDDISPFDTVKSNNKILPFQLVFQNPYTSLDPRFTVYECLNESFVSLSLSATLKRDKIFKVIEEVSLEPSILTKYPHQLSGGERQRIAIARALLLNPDVLVLDEPVSSLDASVKRRILDTILKIYERRRMIVIFISHDLNVIKYCCDYLFVFENGQIVERGSTVDLFNKPQHIYTKKLFESATYFS